MEAELKCRNTASSASGLSFARCWLRAEAVGMEESSPQKSSSSWLIKGNKKKGKPIQTVSATGYKNKL